MKYNDERFSVLDDRWSEFRNSIVENRDGLKPETFQQLMIDTFPLLYEAWNADDKTVSKDAAKLLCTMGEPLFTSCFVPTDDGLEFIGPKEMESMAVLHAAFIQSFVYEDSLYLDEDGNIVISLDDGEIGFTVDPKTFEMPG